MFLDAATEGATKRAFVTALTSHLFNASLNAMHRLDLPARLEGGAEGATARLQGGGAETLAARMRRMRELRAMRNLSSKCGGFSLDSAVVESNATIVAWRSKRPRDKKGEGLSPALDAAPLKPEEESSGIKEEREEDQDEQLEDFFVFGDDTEEQQGDGRMDPYTTTIAPDPSPITLLRQTELAQRPTRTSSSSAAALLVGGSIPVAATPPSVHVEFPIVVKREDLDM